MVRYFPISSWSSSLISTFKIATRQIFFLSHFRFRVEETSDRVKREKTPRRKHATTAENVKNNKNKPVETLVRVLWRAAAPGLKPGPPLAARPYLASCPGSPLPHLLDRHKNLVGCSEIPVRSCPGPGRYTWGRIVELEVGKYLQVGTPAITEKSHCAAVVEHACSKISFLCFTKTKWVQ